MVGISAPVPGLVHRSAKVAFHLVAAAQAAHYNVATAILDMDSQAGKPALAVPLEDSA